MLLETSFKVMPCSLGFRRASCCREYPISKPCSDSDLCLKSFKALFDYEFTAVFFLKFKNRIRGMQIESPENALTIIKIY
jgi:hypothetical protein